MTGSGGAPAAISRAAPRPSLAVGLFTGQVASAPLATADGLEQPFATVAPDTISIRQTKPSRPQQDAIAAKNNFVAFPAANIFAAIAEKALPWIAFREILDVTTLQGRRNNLVKTVLVERSTYQGPAAELLTSNYQ